MSGGVRPGRLLLLAALALSAAAPFALLAVQSGARGWFFPALVPPALDLGAWRSAAAGGSALAAAFATSALVATGVALLATALALPAGRALARLDAPARHVGAAAVFLPVAAPPIALGTGLQVVLLAMGLGGTAPGVLLAHLVPATGYLALFFLGVFGAYDARPEEAARTLGATGAQTLRLVTLPRLVRPLGEALALGFLVSWAQFALTLTVGAGAVRTLPLEVYALVRAGQDREAAVGALLLTVPAMLALAALRWAARRTDALPA
jgi:putative spermidine/putrescine transport system permease protein